MICEATVMMCGMALMGEHFNLTGVLACPGPTGYNGMPALVYEQAAEPKRVSQVFEHAMRGVVVKPMKCVGQAGPTTVSGTVLHR